MAVLAVELVVIKLVVVVDHLSKVVLQVVAAAVLHQVLVVLHHMLVALVELFRMQVVVAVLRVLLPAVLVVPV
jgi:hypothetical protein